MQRIIGGLLSAALLASGLAACSSSNSASTSSSTGASTNNTAKTMTASNGAAVFNTNCASCHQSDGKGGATAPALAGNPLVTGPANKVIHIVKNGLTGAVTVNGKSYNGIMPAWKGVISNDDIAAVITYVRSSWGNKASAVTSAQVASTP
ncbi:MAG TPA: cytochrome c [Candidatus Rubrimentiphilum sp.]|nr:cytochrome c [Candidatus Rubrimentiphilum sp.]